MARPREVSDQQILAVARTKFLEQGAAVTAQEIAAELGVTHTTLFHRFGSKEGLMRAALAAPNPDALLKQLAEGPANEQVLDQLVALTQRLATYFDGVQQAYAILTSAGLDPYATSPGAAFQTSPDRLYREMVVWIQAAQARSLLSSCDASTLAATILGSLQGWALTHRFCRSTCPANDPAEYAERFVRLLWLGIAPSTAPGE